jgi:hypothetical protein
MLDKAKLGTRYTCFKCGCKFYDLSRPVPSCPDCSADQREAPPRDIRALLGSRGPSRKYAEDEDELDTGEGGEDDDEMGYLGGLDDEDDEDEDVDIEEDDDMLEEGGSSTTEDDD